jgi:hypothetical protein
MRTDKKAGYWIVGLLGCGKGKTQLSINPFIHPGIRVHP